MSSYYKCLKAVVGTMSTTVQDDEQLLFYKKAGWLG